MIIWTFKGGYQVSGADEGGVLARSRGISGIWVLGICLQYLQPGHCHPERPRNEASRRRHGRQMDLSNTGRSALRQAQGVLRQAQDDSPPLHDAVLLLVCSGSNPWSVPSPTTFSGSSVFSFAPTGLNVAGGNISIGLGPYGAGGTICW